MIALEEASPENVVNFPPKERTSPASEDLQPVLRRPELAAATQRGKMSRGKPGRLLPWWPGPVFVSTCSGSEGLRSPEVPAPPAPREWPLTHSVGKSPWGGLEGGLRPSSVPERLIFSALETSLRECDRVARPQRWEWGVSMT